MEVILLKALQTLSSFFYVSQLGFTMVFNLEAAFKIWCLGWRAYWSRSLFKFELMLCIGTTLHCIPQLYRTEFTYLAVSQNPNRSENKVLPNEM